MSCVCLKVLQPGRTRLLSQSACFTDLRQNRKKEGITADTLVRLWLCCLLDIALLWTAVWSISAAEWEKLAPCCALLVRGEGKRDRGRVLAWLLNGEFVIYDRATKISVQEEFILAHTHTLSHRQVRFLPCGSWGLLLRGFSVFFLPFRVFDSVGL